MMKFTINILFASQDVLALTALVVVYNFGLKTTQELYIAKQTIPTMLS